MSDERSNQAFGIGIAGVLPVAVAAALVGVRDEVLNANVALALVITVVVASIMGGWQAGAIGAVVAAISYNFFFTRPYLSLTIDSRDDVETTVLLLVVGLIVGVVSARGRRSDASARAGRDEIGRIHRMAELVASGAPVESVIASAQSELAALLHLRRCRFEAPPYRVPYARLERSGVISGVREYRLEGGQFVLPADGVELIVLVRGQGIGRFVLEPQPDVGVSLDQRIVAVALADQVGGAIASGSPTPS